MNICVASGKGGTGKTTVATSLALALQSEQHDVTFLDCDVEEPNGHIFINPDIREIENVFIEVPEIDHTTCTFCGKCADLCAFNALLVAGDSVITFPELCHGCGGCRYFCPAGAVRLTPKKIGTVETGAAGQLRFVRGRLEVGTALSPPLIEAAKKKIMPRGITVIDAPPGTSCPVIASVRGSDFCLLVTEPTLLGLHDLDLAVQMARHLGVPCGVVVNRAQEGWGIIHDYCRRQDLPVLLEIPLSKKIARAYARGVPLVRADKTWHDAFRQLYRAIGEMVAGEGTYCHQR